MTTEERKTGWTPGNWYAIQDDGDEGEWAIFSDIDDGEASLALTYEIGTGDTSVEEDAASKKLYEALYAVMLVYGDEMGPELLSHVRAALAAARGQVS